MLELKLLNEAVAASNEELTYLILVSNEAELINVEEVKFNTELLKAFIDAVVDNMLELNVFKLAVAASNELLIYFTLVSNEAEFTNVDEVKFNTEELNEFIDAVVDNMLALNRFRDAVTASKDELT